METRQTFQFMHQSDIFSNKYILSYLIADRMAEPEDRSIDGGPPLLTRYLGNKRLDRTNSEKQLALLLSPDNAPLLSVPRVALRRRFGGFTRTNTPCSGSIGRPLSGISGAVSAIWGKGEK
jgi:hypothetical protein